MVAHKTSNLGRAIRKSQCIAIAVCPRLTGEEKGQDVPKEQIRWAYTWKEGVEDMCRRKELIRWCISFQTPPFFFVIDRG